MKRLLIVGGALGASAAVVAIAAGAYIWISGGSGEASAPISAPTLALPQASSEPVAQETTIPTTVATDAQIRAAPESAEIETSAAQTLFRIDQAQSRALFEIDEILRGQPNRVIGATDQVAGDIIIDFAAPAMSRLGTIRINARTLETDDSRRDRATRSRVLQSARDEFEFIDFEPTSLRGLPDSVSPGDVLEFTIAGNLTIRDITAEVEFNAKITVTSTERIEGSAVVTIQRATFGLTIPSVRFVASVDDDVVLGIDFVALAVDT